MSFPLEKYRYYVTDKKVVAVSTYAGRTVRGVAVCHPDDKFDVEFGKRVAAAKCNERIGAKRLARAADKVMEADRLVVEALRHQSRMHSYYQDAFVAYNDAAVEYDTLVKNR